MPEPPRGLRFFCAVMNIPKLGILAELLSHTDNYYKIEPFEYKDLYLRHSIILGKYYGFEMKHANKDPLAVCIYKHGLHPKGFENIRE